LEEPRRQQIRKIPAECSNIMEIACDPSPLLSFETTFATFFDDDDNFEWMGLLHFDRIKVQKKVRCGREVFLEELFSRIVMPPNVT
jgi:hypothetical protein